jgi:hypothetical protein
VPAVFITNDMLQQWADQGKVRLDDTTLTLLAENRTVKLAPAVRFTRLIDDAGGDPHKLIGKVKTKDQLVELGAEHYLDSVIFGDVGYTVVEGFMGDLSPQKRAPSTTGADPFAPRETEVKLVRPASSSGPAAAPAVVELPPTPPPVLPSLSPQSAEQLSEAEALSRLFLSTVKG